MRVIQHDNLCATRLDTTVNIDLKSCSMTISVLPDFVMTANIGLQSYSTTIVSLPDRLYYCCEDINKTPGWRNTIKEM